MTNELKITLGMNSIPESVECVTSVADPDYPENWLYHKVIVTTSSQAGVIFKHKLPSNHFSHVFVDECAQIIEPETLIPISLCDMTNGVVVLAGDHKQLGPVVQSTKAEKYGLDCSLMERLMENFDCYDRKDIFQNSGYYDPKFVVKLINNHRSDGQIMAIPSRLFYNNELKFLTKTDEKLLDSVGLKSPVNFYGVDGLSTT